MGAAVTARLWRRALFLPLVNAVALAVGILVLGTCQCLPLRNEPVSVALTFYCAGGSLRVALWAALLVLTVEACIHLIGHALSKDPRPWLIIVLDAVVLGSIVSACFSYIRFLKLHPDELYVFGTGRVDWAYVATIFLFQMIVVALVVFVTEVIVQQTVRVLGTKRTGR
jgi:hypothetical protein